MFLRRLMGVSNRIVGKTYWWEAPDYSLVQLRAQILQGANLKWARAATTANIALNNTTTSIDGVTLVNNDRVLVKNQTAGAENGLYVVNTSGAWARADDMNASEESYNGIVVYVQSGSQADKMYAVTTDTPITLGSTAIAFAQFPPVTSTTVQGLVELATTGEAETGTSTSLAVTPQGARFMTNNLARKADVRLASTANITLGTGTLLVIDGVQTVAGDRILVKNQTATAENGIYVAATGAWTRAADADASADFAFGQEMRVREGTQAGIWYLSSSTTVTVGTTAVAYSPSTSASAHAFWSTAHTDVDTADAPSDGVVPVYRTSNNRFNLESMKPPGLTMFASGPIIQGTGVGHDIVGPGGASATHVGIAADSAPVGGSVTFTFVKEAGGPGGTTSTLGSITLAVSDRLELVTLGSPVSLAYGDTVRLDIVLNSGYTAGSAKNVTGKVWMG